MNSSFKNFNFDFSSNCEFFSKNSFLLSISNKNPNKKSIKKKLDALICIFFSSLKIFWINIYIFFFTKDILDKYFIQIL